MPAILTKTDVRFTELRVFKATDPDDGSVRWQVSIGYDVLTAEGEVFHRDKSLEITDANQKATLVSWFQAIRARVRTEEGLT